MSAFEQLIKDGERLFIEVSPHPLLLTSMQESAKELAGSCHFIPSLRREQNSEACLLASYSRLFTAGYPVKWEAMVSAGANLADAPGHPFRKERVWMASEGGERAAEQVFARVTRQNAHPLLPLRFDLAHEPGVHVWEGTLDPIDHPFLTQHLVQGERILPAVAYYELAYAMGVEILGPGPKTLSNIRLHKALFLPAKGTVRIQAVLAPSGADTHSVRVYCDRKRRGETSDPQLCCEMTVRQGPAKMGTTESRRLPSEFPDAFESAEFYELTKTLGFEYGPLYQGIRRAWLDGGESIAELTMPGQIQQEKGFYIHPAFLDTVVQLPCLPVSRAVGRGKPFLPVSVDEVYFAGPLSPHQRVWATSRLHGGLHYDATLTAEDGTILFRVLNATCREMKLLQSESVMDYQPGWLYNKRWDPSSVPEPTAPGPSEWLLIGDSAEVQSFGASLKSHGLKWRAGAPGPNEDLNNPGIGGIVYLPALAKRPQDGDPATSQETLCGGLLRLIQSMVKNVPANPSGVRSRLFVAARGVNLIHPGDRVETSAGPLFGLARTAGTEVPRLQITTVDLDPQDQSCEALITEISPFSRDRSRLPPGRTLRRPHRQAEGGTVGPPP